MGGMQALGMQDGLGNLRITRTKTSSLAEIGKQFSQHETPEIRRHISEIEGEIRQVWMGTHYTPWLQMYGKPSRRATVNVSKPTWLGTWTQQEMEILTKMVGIFASGDKHFAARHDEIYAPR